MTISFVNTGAAASGTTTAAIPQPASPAKDNLFICMVGGKPFGSTPIPPMTGPAYDVLTTGTSGSVANGNGTGSVRAAAFRHHVDGTETGGGTITFSLASGSPTIGRMYHFSKTADAWDLAATTLSDTDETLTTVSATGAAIDIASGDTLLFGVLINDEAPNHTSQAVSVPSCTLGAITWESKDSTISGNDAGLYLGRCTVTAGTSSGAPTYTATSSVSGSSSTAVAVVRLREVNRTAEPVIRAVAAGGTEGTVPTTQTSHVIRTPVCNLGEQLVAAFTLNGGFTSVTETGLTGSGWTRQFPVSITDDTFMALVVYTKTANSTDAAGGGTYTLTTGVACRSNWGTASLVGAAPAPNVSNSATGSGTGASVSLNSTAGNTRVLSIVAVDSSSEAVTSTSPLIEVWEPSLSLAGQVNAGASAAKAATGSVSYAWSWSTSLQWKSWAAAWPTAGGWPPAQIAQYAGLY